MFVDDASSELYGIRRFGRTPKGIPPATFPTSLLEYRLCRVATMSPRWLLFHPFRLDSVNQEFWRGDDAIDLRPKTFAFLLYLARHPRRLVTKQELLTNLWPDVSVSQDLLRGYVREIRSALGDDARTPRYLATVARRGYKFLPEVITSPSEEPGASSDTPLSDRAVEGPPASTPRSTKPPIKVGVLHSLTGRMAAIETPVVDATLFAIEEVNRNGGVRGRPVAAYVADGQSDELVFAREAERLITQNGVGTLFGCWTSASRKTVRDVVESLDSLLFYPVQFEGMEESPNIVYTGAAPNQQILPAIRWTFGFLRKRRYFLVGSDTVFSWAANAIIRDEVQILGGEIVGEAYLSDNGANITKVVHHIAKVEPDLVVNCVSGELSIAYSRALRAAGILPSQIPTMYFSAGELELLSLAPSESVGDYAAWNYFQSIDRPENKAFLQRFRSRYGSWRVVSDPMEAAYLGVHLWAQAVEAANGDGARALRLSLRNQSFEAPEGLVRIDPESLYTWKTMRVAKVVVGGQLEVMWSSERPLRPEPFASSRSPASWSELLLELFRRWGGHWSAGFGGYGGALQPAKTVPLPSDDAPSATFGRLLSH
jgi:urea transport system substrate-binding protein